MQSNAGTSLVVLTQVTRDLLMGGCGQDLTMTFAALTLRQKVQEEACRMPEEDLAAIYETLAEKLRAPHLPYGVAQPLCEALSHMTLVRSLTLDHLREYCSSWMLYNSSQCTITAHQGRIHFPYTSQLLWTMSCRRSIALPMLF